MIMCDHKGRDGKVIFAGDKLTVLTELAYMVKYAILAVDTEMSLEVIEAAIEEAMEELQHGKN